MAQTLTLSVGGMTCAACTTAIADALEELGGVRDVSISLLTNSATVTVDDEKLATEVTKTIEEIGYEAEVVNTSSAVSDKLSEDLSGSYSVSLAIGGMTCAACSTTITHLLSEIEGVSEVAINLLGHSGYAQLASKDRLSIVVEAIECAGYDVTVQSVEIAKASTIP